MSTIQIRHAHIGDCHTLACVLIDATDGAFRGRVPDACLDWLTPEISAANWAKNFITDETLEVGDWLFVAETDAGEVVGFAMLSEITAEFGYEAPISQVYSHELLSLHVAPAWQRRGVGKKLVTHTQQVMQEVGGSRLLVRVLVENPNVPFYERLGAIRLMARPYTWEGYQTEEYLYGWN